MSGPRTPPQLRRRAGGPSFLRHGLVRAVMVALAMPPASTSDGSVRAERVEYELRPGRDSVSPFPSAPDRHMLGGRRHLGTRPLGDYPSSRAGEQVIG